MYNNLLTLTLIYEKLIRTLYSVFFYHLHWTFDNKYQSRFHLKFRSNFFHEKTPLKLNLFTERRGREKGVAAKNAAISRQQIASYQWKDIGRRGILAAGIPPLEWHGCQRAQHWASCQSIATLCWSLSVTFFDSFCSDLIVIQKIALFFLFLNKSFSFDFYVLES